MDTNQKATMRILGNVYSDTIFDTPDNFFIIYKKKRETRLAAHCSKEDIKNYAKTIVQATPEIAEELMVALSTELQRKELEK